MKGDKKIDFLWNREYQLGDAAALISYNVDRFADHEMYATEFSDFTNRLEACLREIKAIRAAIGDKADELGGVNREKQI